jgi:two-component system cell cycle response regulator DivK
MIRILLVEDNELNRDMLSRRLIRRGCGVRVAEDGAQALRMVLEERPDIVLMDIGLPDIDGWEVTRRMRAETTLSGLPILALTAHAMESDRELARAAGCDDFDTKPVEFERLLHKIEALVSRPGTDRP